MQFYSDQLMDLTAEQAAQSTVPLASLGLDVPAWIAGITLADVMRIYEASADAWEPATNQQRAHAVTIEHAEAMVAFVRDNYALPFEDADCCLWHEAIEVFAMRLVSIYDWA